MSNHYVPGVCNIGRPEIDRRKRFSLGGYISSFIWLFILLISDIPPIWGLLLAIPAWVLTVNYLQVKNKFCVYYGMLGVTNTSQTAGKTSKVQKKSDIEIDHLKSISMISISILIAVIAGIIGYMITNIT